MSDTLRMTGLYSGMDTESIITALVSAKQTKVDNLKNEQKKLEWKQTIWQDLNSKIYSFYSKTLSNMRLTGSYSKQTTKVSDSTKASIVASGSAVNGTQTLKINSLAKSSYLTGARVDKTTSTISGKIPNATNGYLTSDGSTSQTAYVSKSTSLLELTTSEKAPDSSDSTAFGDGDVIEISSGSGETLMIKVVSDSSSNSWVTGETFHSSDEKINGKTVYEVKTLGGLIDAVNSKVGEGFSASYDETTGNFSIGSSVSTSGSGLSIKILNKASSSTTDYSYVDTDTTTNKLKALGLDGTATTSEKETYTTDSKVSAINKDLIGKTITITTGTGSDATTTDIEITSDMKISEFITALKGAGVNASFDETNQRFFISSKSTGTANAFTLSASDPTDKNVTSASILAELGLDSSESGDSYAKMVEASDAEIVLNGATFTSSTNTFSINGLTINTTGVTADNEELTITTETDYDGIYDMIKDFISEYNSIINEIYQRYNADSARDYDMLTDDEKESMTDDEVEKWEDTIKGALLRKDTTLSTLMSSIYNVMNASYGTDSNGNKRYLFTYGIETLGYFEADEDERYALHIAGDPDDENTSSDDDLLKTALATDLDGTIDFFATLSKTLYDTLNTAMKATDYSSIYKVYEDKRLQTEYDDYTTKISDAEDELSDYEDRWYSKFSSMETALSKLQSTQSVVSSMLGTS